ncbi:2-oxoacid:acceptor oxidoreductase subunit alpha [Desulfurispirillum indicum]|uniref:Pyruvate flavodoxin/ferredoxin oxidoreductase domain protein n=1 Tax=Desulfurispirillum indicum (strain ATCC BAA-1389 / DSM 22839 / S5) TaxID=653733 RepID=E6W395_DESIS|nr:2-oxoacid:acceptor oxidoreductase subunit alpha [Desulfurispirillum indicum]ADU66849.1 pyruvate flavodoxin/ferredoxin oxidoreductase domain protein [Desulfurispirillum indicum S5]UCZ56168.1 2-oxoacid:acceptor oxidoreductase subunit alpha [Desulfurispirillum indicum]
MPQVKEKNVEQVVIKFTGDSGDGMQLVGNQLTALSALSGNDVNSLPDYPSEIRAPAGTVAGISGFQICLGSKKIHTAGDAPDVLVAMNPAAVKHSYGFVVRGGMIITDSDTFTEKALEKAGFKTDPRNDGTLAGYDVKAIPFTTLTREALKDLDMSPKDKDRCKNFFVLGVLCWLFNKDPQEVLSFITTKFKKLPMVEQANTLAFKGGMNYGETMVMFQERYNLQPASIQPGLYRNISGNEASALAIAAAAKKSGLQVVLGSYPITPATDIFSEASKYKNHNVVTIQMEDEIGGICAAIGGSLAGKLGVTNTSGPGLALKSEALGLAVIMEIPLVIIDVQRGGPSTGLPTKTEQSDLLQAMYGRNGDSPIPVLAASTPDDCFAATYEACAVALKYMTPVLLLTDGYIGQGTCPWKVPKESELPDIPVKFFTEGEYKPYRRDPKTLARDWAIPGTKDLQHRIGSLEKDALTGAVSHVPANHQIMTDTRMAKVAGIEVPDCEINGADSGEVLVISWGGTYGAVKGAVDRLISEGKSVSSINLRWINPMPKNLGSVISRFKKVLIPELNTGQLSVLIRSRYLVDTVSLGKVKGDPFREYEVIDKVKELLGE